MKNCSRDCPGCKAERAEQYKAKRERAQARLNKAAKEWALQWVEDCDQGSVRSNKLARAVRAFERATK